MNIKEKKNIINGLIYGNGGLKCWTKDFVLNMKTHENSDPNDTESVVEFCFDPRYYQMNGCYSTSYINGSPFQAWRAGFREGVKMCLNRGAVPTVDEFKETVASRNLNNLTIWHNVGQDVENGIWAIYGARLGTYMTLLTDWEHTNVQWFDNYVEMWEEYKDKDPAYYAEEVGENLKNKLGLPICTLNASQSKFFKRHYSTNFHNKGPLITEMEVIRKIEGW